MNISFRKIISTVLAGAMAFSSFAMLSSSYAVSDILGDVNGDSVINSTDALDVLSHTVGSKALDSSAMVRADVNKDSSINSTDALLILQYAIGNIDSFGEETSYGLFTKDDMLEASGKKIVNQKGEEVHLRGVNLGGWLIHEDWMCPVTSVDTYTTYEVLTQRFGQEKTYELINEYEDNWITEYDLDLIKELGFNCVRVPFWYRNFYYDDKGTKILDENGEWDFSRLDWIIEECGKRGLYVIPDLHGAPGYQSNKDHSGKVNSSVLFDSGSENYRLLTIELWTAIAERFADNPTIAMYDLLNEPNCDTAAYITKNNAATISLYDRLYKAIRQVDPDRMMTMEGIWRLYNLPNPSSKGWTNVVYQLHLYQEKGYEFKMLCSNAALYPYNVPIFVGEFKSLGAATWDDIMSSFNDNNFSWTTWSYKGYGNGASYSDWFIVGSNESSNNVDVNSDSYETIMKKWGESTLKTENNFSKTGLDKTLQPYI